MALSKGCQLSGTRDVRVVWRLSGICQETDQKCEFEGEILSRKTTR